MTQLSQTEDWNGVIINFLHICYNVHNLVLSVESQDSDHRQNHYTQLKKTI